MPVTNEEVLAGFHELQKQIAKLAARVESVSRRLEEVHALTRNTDGLVRMIPR